MSATPFLDDIGEQILAELGTAPLHSAPRVSTLEDGHFSVGSHIGLRRSRNEDRTAIARVDISDNCSYSISIVCDGVGSSRRGDEAAAIACSALISLLSAQTTYHPAAELLCELVKGADEIVRQRLQGSGLTTACILLATSRRDFAVTNIGDSRAYSWEHGSELIQLTEDDTLENEVKRLRLPGGSFLNERRLEGSLSQALGEPDRTSNELRIKVAEPHSLPPGSILLASDGAWVNGEVAFQKIAKNCSEPGDLVRRVLTAALWLGGVDNASAVAVRDPQALPAVGAIPKVNTRITVWLPETRFVVYRNRNAPAIPFVADPAIKRTGKATGKKKGKKAEASPDQLSLPEGGSKDAAGHMVVGPDEG